MKHAIIRLEDERRHLIQMEEEVVYAIKLMYEEGANPTKEILLRERLRIEIDETDNALHMLRRGR
jgi:hypothetical protein